MSDDSPSWETIARERKVEIERLNELRAENERLQNDLRDAKQDAIRLHDDKMKYLSELLLHGIEPPVKK